MGFASRSMRSVSGPKLFALFAVLLAGSLFLGAVLTGGVATAAPSEEEVEAARQEVAYAEMSVAQLEVELAQTATTAREAQIDYGVAAEEALEAELLAEEARDSAEDARAEAKKANKAFQEGLDRFASVAQNTYRSGNGSLSGVAPYLESDGLQVVEQRRAVQSTVDTAADNQMQEVAALEQVARITEEAAEKAEEKQSKAAKKAEERATEAQKLADEAGRVHAEMEAAQEVMLAELAEKRATSVALERERMEEIERSRQEQARRAAEQEAANNAEQAPAQSEPSTQENSSGNSSSGSSSSGDSSSGSESSESTPAPAPSNPAPSTPAPSTPAPAPAPAPKPAPKPQPAPAPSAGSSHANAIIGYAKSKMGSRYVWGAEGPNTFDCSGLVTAAYRSIGIYVPHYTGSQYAMASKVPFSQRQPGDLIFWARGGDIYHVAIYLGNDQVIHASQPSVPLGIQGLYNWDRIMPYVGRI